MQNTTTIVADHPYSVPGLARVMDSGTRNIYGAIRARKLKAAKINDRGDLRIMGSWALAYLESLAK